ncbi:MAG: FAD-dependent oxidoreductase [Longimicrobiales bacterium]
MRATPDALVMGGGAFGLSAARALRARGRIVTLVDAGPVPHPRASSTDISKIVRMDYGSDAFYARLAESALAGWRAWNDLQERPLFHDTGFALFAAAPMAPGGFEYESRRVLAELGHEVERVDAAGIARRFPAWAPDAWADGYVNTNAGWAESGRAVAWLADRARSEGVDILERTPVADLVDGSTPGVRLADGSVLRAGSVVVAAGAWTATLLPELDGVLRPVGQAVFHLRPDDPEPFRQERFPTWGGDIASTGWYGFPVTADGIVKVANHGSGLPVDPRNDVQVPPSFDGQLRAFLADKLPALADAPVVSRRLCLYCDTADADFWIDRHPDRPGVLVMAGGSGHGFKFMPVLGDVVADVLDGVENPWAHRFRWRDPSRRKEHARFAGDPFAEAGTG